MGIEVFEPRQYRDCLRKLRSFAPGRLDGTPFHGQFVGVTLYLGTNGRQVLTPRAKILGIKTDSLTLPDSQSPPLLPSLPARYSCLPLPCSCGTH